MLLVNIHEIGVVSSTFFRGLFSFVLRLRGLCFAIVTEDIFLFDIKPVEIGRSYHWNLKKDADFA